MSKKSSKLCYEYIRLKKRDTTHISLCKYRKKGKKSIYKHSNEIAPGVLIDVSKSGKIIGIEIVRKHDVDTTRYYIR